MFIQTELCELGNFADFLLEYGKTYDRLDESRLWKIKSEIAAVGAPTIEHHFQPLTSGLSFRAFIMFTTMESFTLT